MESLFNLFQIKYPDFEKHLKSLPESLYKRILVKLQKESNIETFTSILAEVDFGLLFNKLGFILEYEKPYNKQTPDWTISKGD